MVANNPNFTLRSFVVPTGTSVNFSLSIERLLPFFFAFNVSGKIGKNAVSDPLGVNGIWQMRMTKKGKVPVKMKFYTPTNPQTEAQEANRLKFKNAMQAWGSLTDEQKQEYNKRAKKRQMFGWGLFIREYYQAN